MSEFIKDELNVSTITVDDRMDQWCSFSTSTTREGNKTLGKHHKKQFKQVLKELKALPHDVRLR